MMINQPPRVERTPQAKEMTPRTREERDMDKVKIVLRMKLAEALQRGELTDDEGAQGVRLLGF